MALYNERREDDLLTLPKAVNTVVEDKVQYTDGSKRDDIKADYKWC